MIRTIVGAIAQLERDAQLIIAAKHHMDKDVALEIYSEEIYDKFWELFKNKIK